MNNDEAKFILRAYRPGGPDAADPQFAEALAGVGIDEPTAPFEIPNVGWVILILRPFDEVVDGIRDVIAQPGLAELRDELLRTADVSVGSQYGRWDATKGEVIPF